MRLHRPRLKAQPWDQVTKPQLQATSNRGAKPQKTTARERQSMRQHPTPPTYCGAAVRNELRVHRQKANERRRKGAVQHHHHKRGGRAAAVAFRGRVASGLLGAWLWAGVAHERGSVRQASAQAGSRCRATNGWP